MSGRLSEGKCSGDQESSLETFFHIAMQNRSDKIRKLLSCVGKVE
jgi:hypothetical protein